jgi:acetolactate synthase-1/3 small subunit
MLELAVHDPMAAVRHVTGLLARRAHRLLAMACLPDPDGGGRMLLEVADDGRLERLAIELAHLPEVSSARRGGDQVLSDLFLAAPAG